MRSFPGAPGPRARAATVVAVLACGLATVPTVSPAHADWRDTLRETRQRIEAARSGIEDASRRARQAAARLGDARARLSTAQSRLADLEGRVAEAEARSEQLRTDLARSRQTLLRSRAALAAARAEVEATRERAADAITALYQGAGDPGLRTLSSFLTAGSLEEVAAEQRAESLIVDGQAADYDAVREARARLAALEAEVEETTATIAEKKDEAEGLVSRLRTLRAGAQAARDLVAGTVAETRTAQRRAESAREADRIELAELRQQEAQVQAKIDEAARRAAAAGTGYTGSTGSLLSPPASGPVTSGFGNRVHPIYGYYGMHDGTDFGVACGQPLRAAAAGTVISVYSSAVYGNRLYLSVGTVNGHNVTVVYNHASSYTYGVGARVAEGATLGYVGNTGWSTGCHLHFSVLEDGRAVDPMGYL